MRTTQRFLRLPVVVAAVLTLVASLGLAAPARATSACALAGMETISLRTFYLEIKADKKLYSVGDVAKIHVNVTRPADEDPLGEGIPLPRPTSEPAAEVNIGIGLAVGRVYLPGAGMTDENGDAVVKIKIENYAPRNQWVDASVYAWNVVHQDPCFTVQEEGFEIVPRMFRTAP